MSYGTIQANAIQGSINTFSPNSAVFRNRIINGAMVIDQRNAGASVTVNANATFYATDRFACFGQVTDGVFTIQRSTTAPTGFINSLIATVTTADASIGATQEYGISQNIEGFNLADLDWGTANAKAVTLSFWVRSSVTGTHSGSLSNSAYNRAYAYSYTISSANTWEYKTITIAGDTTGTWLKDNGVGLRVRWNLGTGSTYLGTAGVWGSSFLNGATGSVQLISTNGATFYITGVQLEVGSTATSFDYRPYGTELALCQRYYQITNANIRTGATNGNSYSVPLPFLCEMRASPTATLSGGASGNVSSDTVENITARGARYTIIASATSISEYSGRIVALSVEL